MVATSLSVTVRAPARDVLDDLGRLARDERATLARAARREGLEPEDAVDAVHDALCTFLRLAQRGEVPEEHADHPRFLVALVRNAARNRRRRHDRARPHHDIDAVQPAAGAETSSEQLVARAEEHVRLRACVDRLCDTQKAVVTLRMLEERNGEDVAAALGIARGHVDVLLHRAKIALRACLLEDDPA